MRVVARSWVASAIVLSSLFTCCWLPGQSIETILFGFTNSWRYNQTTSYDGVNWTARGFDDSALAIGRGVLGLEDTGNPFVIPLTNTVLALGRTTYYFRTHFTLTNIVPGMSLKFSNVVDDGAVFYLNGVEVQRLYMTNGAPVTYASFCTNHEASAFDVFTVTGPAVTTNLVSGDNVLAVEVHQTTAGSSDIAFGCALSATYVDTNAPPTLRMPPDAPSYGYVLNNAFPGLTFSAPIALATPPGETNRLFVLERSGRVTVITNLAAPNRTVFMDISSRITGGCEEGLLGIAFHPGYATNGYFFLYYSTTASTAVPGGTNVLHQRLSRFQAASATANSAQTNTEVVLFTQRDEACNHNGGDLHFGPDGYLYVSLGDEGNQNDSFNNSQTIRKDFFSGILRLDVDKRPGNLLPNPHPSLAGQTNYFVPADNPWLTNSFVGDVNASGTLRTEFYAVGLRNPWRFSFDPVTGWLWCGDVGGSAREEVDIITKGGNYGWAFREGFIAGPKANSGASVINPIHDYPHGTTGTNVGLSITGGLVYRGNRLSRLTGAYVFADYGSGSPGNMWSLRYDGTNVSEFQWLLADANLVAFGTDPRNDDLLAADIADGQIKRLNYDTNISVGAQLPVTLADTGAFTNLMSLTNQTQALPANAGIIPYDINVHFWSDGARKSRWFFMPTNGARIGFAAEGNWSLPPGMAWVKHFDLELTNGVASSARRLETRILVRNSNGMYGVTYRWGNSITNATLVGDQGLDESFTISDGGILRTQVWHYPGRAECLSCHTPVGGWALGFNTVQMNGSFSAGSNQIEAMIAAGYFTSPVTNVHALRALAPATDENSGLEWRVRSYLAANCAQCHQSGGAGLGYWNASITNSTSGAGLINGTLISNDGNTNARVIVPGSITNSALLSRIARRGTGQMPPLATSVLDTQAIGLLSRWITNDLANGWTNAIAPLNLAVTRSNTQVAVQFTQLTNRAYRIETASSLSPPVAWQFLNVPENRPTYPASNVTVSVTDGGTVATQKFYRVRVSAP